MVFFLSKYMKTAYISPANGELEITIIREGNPYVVIELDLGIPNFTRFSLKFPLIIAEPNNMSTVTQEALGILLDEVATFMMSMKYDKEVITDIYARALSAFSGMNVDSSTQAKFTDVAQDPNIETYKALFKLPQSFVQETQERVVTSAAYIKRAPAVRQIEFGTAVPTNKNNMGDLQRTIRQFRNRQLKTQPKPLYVIVYDVQGRPTGVLPVAQRWKSQLLQRIQAAFTPGQRDSWDFAAPDNWSTEMSMLSHGQNNLCPQCEGPLDKKMWTLHRDGEGEGTHYTGNHTCGANLTVFND